MDEQGSWQAGERALLIARRDTDEPTDEDRRPMRAVGPAAANAAAGTAVAKGAAVTLLGAPL